MATLGAGVLHNRSVELAKKHGVALVVRSSLTTEEGTVVKESVKSRDNEISGVAGDDDAARIAVMGIEDTRSLRSSSRFTTPLSRDGSLAHLRAPGQAFLPMVPGAYLQQVTSSGPCR